MKVKLLKLFGFVMVALFIIGCQKELQEPVKTEIIQLEETSKSIVNLSIEKQYDYVRENLKKIMTELAPLFKDQPFIHYLKTEAEKKFDGDNNILVKTILDNANYGQRANTARMKTALNAFKGIDGSNLYPQIYFPYFDTHQANNINGANSTEAIEAIEIVIYNGNEAITTLPIYKYNSENKLIETGKYANEAYAKDNQVIIISLNETVNSAGEVNPQISTRSNQNRTEAIVNFRINDLTVTDGKESWTAGASEVNMKANGTTWTHILDGNTSGPFVSIPPNLHYYSQTSYQGDEIRKIPRGEIGYPIWNINYPMNINWQVDNYYVDPIVYTYVIFEYDAWPAGVKSLACYIPSVLNPSYQYDAMNFRSSNSPYGGIPSNSYINNAIYGNVSGLPANYQFLFYNGYQVNSNGIQFDTEAY